MEKCPYCNEFMEISKDSPNCPHLSIDPANEWCCTNCDLHFDLNLNEVPTNAPMGNKEYVFTPTPEPTPPSDSKSDSTTPTTPTKPSSNFPPAQIALAKQVLLKLQEYQDFSKIKTSVIPIIESMQSYLARESIA